MRFVFVILLPFWLFFSPLQAQKQSENTYTIYKDQTLGRQGNDILLKEGDSTIILITHHVGGDVRTDQGYYEEIWLSLPALEKEFTWSAIESTGYLIRKCRCVDAGINAIIQGEITGYRVRKHWTINVEITARGGDTGENYDISLEVLCPSK